MLGVKTAVVRGLVAQRVLSADVASHYGLSKLVPTEDIHRFAEQYVSATVFARRFNIGMAAFARHLIETSTRVLRVPVLEQGRAPALFIPVGIAAKMRISGRL